MLIAAFRAVLLQVLLDDLVDLYRRVFARILSREDARASPYARYYLGTSTPLVWKDIATLFGKTLKEMGKIEDPVPQSISVAEDWSMCVWHYPNSLTSHVYSLYREQKVYLGASQRVQGERAKALGWEPRPVVLGEWMHGGKDEPGGVEIALRVLQKTE